MGNVLDIAVGEEGRVSYKAELTAAVTLLSIRICRETTAHLRKHANRAFGHCPLLKEDIHQYRSQ